MMSNPDSIWRPYTQHKTMGALIDISRGDGPYLYTKDGRQILDLISSWWVNIHGHCHPVDHIVEFVVCMAFYLGPLYLMAVVLLD